MKSANSKLVKGWVGTISPKGVTTYQEEESRNAFQEGHAAFLRNWPYVYALANGKDSLVKGRVDVTTLPQGDGPNAGHTSTLGGWQLMLHQPMHWSEKPMPKISG
jgi:trehalose/maltose transport system substrate-binding protein